MRLFIILVALYFCASTALPAEGPSFGIEESIGFHKLVYLDSTSRSGREYAKFSENGDYFATLVRRGDLKKGANIDTLNIYRSADIVAYLDSNVESPPSPIRTIEISSLDDEPPIQRARWINSKSIGFVAPDMHGVRQVFVADIGSATLKQFTNHDSDVVNFDYKNGVLIFYAKPLSRFSTQTRQAADDAQRDGVAISVEDQSLIELIDSNYSKPGAVGIMEIYTMTRESGIARRIKGSRGRMFYDLAKSWLSPDGRYAIVLFPPANAPPHWGEYTTVSQDLVGIKPNISDPTSWNLYDYTRFMLVDINALTMKPLLDAPTGQQLNWNPNVQNVLWNSDSASVIVTNTYLPLTEANPKERRIRSQSTAIAEVHITPRRVQRIRSEPLQSWEELKSGAPLKSVGQVRYDVVRGLLSVQERVDSGPLSEPVIYGRNNGTWQRVDRAMDHWDENSAQFGVVNSEDMNTPPRLIVKSNNGDRDKLLLDPNPSLVQAMFGRVEEVRWTDENGIEWEDAGLFYPSSYKPGRKYPLVVQTHGFSRNEFLIDGPGGATAPFAARAFASRGFMVLQVDEPSSVITADEREGPLVVSGIKAGVELLVKRGLVDQERMGIIGWSRTGYHVLHAIVREPDIFEAAIIADAAQYSYVQYISMTNFSRSSNTIKMNGGAMPVGEGLQEWARYAPTFNLDRVSAAVRLETYGGLTTLISMWEAYAMLKNLGNPVDFVYLPDAPHLPVKPQERLFSQKGSLQWFLFWLQGVEEPDPVFANQYARWSKMRTERCSWNEPEDEEPSYCKYSNAFH